MEKMQVKFTSIKKLTEKKEFPFYLMPGTYKHYRRIYNTVEMFWGSDIFSEHISKLMLTDRNNRSGFEPAVLSELIALQTAHEKMFPQFVKADIWAHNFVL